MRWRGLGKAIVAAVALAGVLVLAACTGAGSSSGTGSTGNVGSASSEPSGATFTPPAHVTMPVIAEDAPSIDTTHVADGYVVAHTSSAGRLKFQVINGEETYNYDLPNDGTPAVFPINMGNGAYRFRIMKNTGGNNYMEAEAVEANVVLSSEFAPFLIPNQYCDYRDDSACVVRARELTAGAPNQGEAVKRICEWVVGNIKYDTAKAQTLSATTGYIPNPDATLESCDGVCFDYASLGAAMLRSQGFPAKIITGYVSPGDIYHAWIMVYVDGSWQTTKFAVNANTWSRIDLTFAASDNVDLVGDGTTYTDRYVY